MSHAQKSPWTEIEITENHLRTVPNLPKVAVPKLTAFTRRQSIYPTTDIQHESATVEPLGKEKSL